MLLSISNLLILAEGEAPRENGSILIFLVPLVAIFVVYYFMDAPRRRDQGRRDQMLKNMKKNDRIVTIGGILGSIVDISTDGKEVTVKVSDSSRIRFRRSAIAEVFGDEPAEPAKST